MDSEELKTIYPVIFEMIKEEMAALKQFRLMGEDIPEAWSLECDLAIFIFYKYFNYLVCLILDRGPI